MSVWAMHHFSILRAVLTTKELARRPEKDFLFCFPLFSQSVTVDFSSMLGRPRCGFTRMCFVYMPCCSLPQPLYSVCGVENRECIASTSRQTDNLTTHTHTHTHTHYPGTPPNNIISQQ
ncbi:unnamed protein product [Periconia digitata]|uniref:Uncharacterized protein n=1 Tax=Periconia digitata TaxID=1303443 RepID=A0A9W4U9F4_9PLEO|nr:unnamed protein product [Periconia digitata]